MMKLSNKKRKYRKFWHGCLLLGILLTALAVPVWGRAGGGSSGGGGGHSGSSGGGSYHSGRSSSRSNLTGNILFGVNAIVVTCGGAIAFTIKAKKAAAKSRNLMRQYEKIGGNWDYREVQRQVEEAYYQIQECWRRMDAGYAAAYLSEELLEDFNMKIQWMEVREEEVVQKHVKLLSAVPVGAYDELGEENDCIRYLIHGSMVGYYINRNTKICVRGNTKKESFYEYWKFIYRNERWVLQEIRQQDEIDINQFV